MKNWISVLALCFVSIGISNCSHRSVLPDTKELTVRREPPSGKCKELGSITGTTASAKGTQEQALEDLKREAVNKGATYVMVKEFSSYGTTVTGLAYECE